MRPIATNVTRSVVCVCLCVGHNDVLYARKAEPIEMPCVELTHGGPRNHVGIRWGQDRTDPFAATRGEKSAMRLIVKLFRRMLSNNYGDKYDVGGLPR